MKNRDNRINRNYEFENFTRSEMDEMNYALNAESSIYDADIADEDFYKESSELDNLDEELSIIKKETEENAGGSYARDAYMTVLMRQFGSMPRLTREREVELSKIIQTSEGDKREKALSELVNSNLLLLPYCAKKYYVFGGPVEMCEYIDAGFPGLRRAAELFDGSRGVKFATYAVNWIKQAMRRDRNKYNSIIIPVNVASKKYKVTKAKRDYEEKYGYAPTTEELAAISGVSEKEINKFLAYDYSVSSFNNEIDQDGNSYLEVLEDTNAIDPCEQVTKNDFVLTMRELIDKLPEREADIIKLKYGLDGGDGLTLEAIGKLPQYSLSRERVRQILDKAQRDLRRLAVAANI